MLSATREYRDRRTFRVAGCAAGVHGNGAGSQIVHPMCASRTTHHLGLPQILFNPSYIHRASGLAQIAVSTPLRFRLQPTRNLSTRALSIRH